VLQKAQVPAEDAEITAKNLLKAELWGVLTHGISRLARYVMRLENGTINPAPQIKIKSRYPAMLSVDGDNGLGTVVMEKALWAAMERAEQFGVCTVGVYNSNHFGMAGYYCSLAAEKNMISIGFTNSLAAMAPWGGKQACLGTNPIAFGFPRVGKVPIVADMATSIVARGKILLAAKKEENIPEGWALDKKGYSTTNAKAALEGIVLPMAGPKSYSMALSIDCLSGVLTGAAFADLVGSYSNGKTQAAIGHLFVVMKSDGFLEAGVYEERIEFFCRKIKSMEKIAGVEEIYLPGEREQLREQKLQQQGITLPAAVEKELYDLSCRYEVSLEVK